MTVWNLSDAKARFSYVIEAVLWQGPQTVTRRGKPAAVIVSYQHYKAMDQAFQLVLGQAKAERTSQSDQLENRPASDIAEASEGW